MAYPVEKCAYPEDVRRILRVALDHGIVASALEAEKAWEDYSDLMCASWMFLPKDDAELWACLPEWFTGSPQKVD